MFCSQCGGEIAAGAAFCNNCGAAMAGPVLPAQGVAGAPVPMATPLPDPSPGGYPATVSYTAAPPAGWSPGGSGQYYLSAYEFISPQDRSAMQTLQSTGGVNQLIQTFVGKFGKPWLESSFLGNGVRIGPKQYPLLYQLACELGEIFCLARLPDVYVVNLYNTPLAIARSTRSATIGTDTEAFVVLDAKLLGRLGDKNLTIAQLRQDPICFLLASELAHVALGHALWLGIALWLSLRGPSGVAGLISRPLIMPLIYWARQAVLSSDRGVLLATGRYREYRDAVLSNLVVFPRLVATLNVEAYLSQMESRSDRMETVGRFLEAFSSTMPYVSRRITALDEFAADPTYTALRVRVEEFTKTLWRD